MKGLVLKSTGSHYKVMLIDEIENSALPNYDETKIIDAVLRGKLRLDQIKSTNPVVVGDRVELIQTENGWAIDAILPRKNYIIRKATNQSKQTHIIAANIDLACVIASIAVPMTSTGFIDRFLVTAEAYSIPAAVVFHKIDLIEDQPDAMAYQQELADIYKSIGYKVLLTSLKYPESLQSLKSLITNKITLLSGHSGVGKSSIINAIQPHLNLKVGKVSFKHLKGKHTTTYAELLPLDFGGFIIDTPGIKEFGLVNMDKYEVSHYFPEMRRYLGQCKFNNCLHINEPGCKVLQALENGEITQSRYKSYLSILDDEDFREVLK
ncbi:MAG: ribosome small subunit-dependent GTPase A [Bacteroidia bacterium]|jgi:ribosome biogenesis GTPase|nr:ribosome small subunit-dependent GTPase A [Bacteroidia bacterium]